MPEQKKTRKAFRRLHEIIEDDWLPIDNDGPSVGMAETDYDEHSLLPVKKEWLDRLQHEPGRTNQERNFFKKMMMKLPKESLTPMFAAMPTNDKMLVFNITNLSNSSFILIRNTISSKAQNRMAALEKRCLEDCTKAKMAQSQYQQRMQELQDKQSREIDELLINSVEAASEEVASTQKVMVESYVEYAANRRIANAEVLRGQILIPFIADSLSVVFAEVSTSKDARNIFSRMVSDKIVSLLTDDATFLGADERRLFSLEKNQQTVPFAIIQVNHRPETYAKQYFEDHFLLRADQIMKLIREKLNAVNTNCTVTVLVRLGTDKIPPRKMDQDRLRQNLLCDLNSIFAKYIRDRLRDEINLLNRFCSEDPRTPQLIQTRQDVLNHYDRTVRSCEDGLRLLPEKRSHKYEPDPIQMKTEILYPRELCVLCLTTSHTFRECKMKRCSICFDLFHPAVKCEFKCDCRKGFVHAMEECTLSKARQACELRGSALLEARIRNEEQSPTLST